MRFLRHVGKLSGGAFGLGLSTAIAWAGASSGLELLSEITFTVEDILAAAIAEFLFGVLVLVACAVCATATAQLLASTLDRWLQLVATGHCQPPAGESPGVAIAAHSVFTLFCVVSGASVLRAGLLNDELNWTVEGLLLVLIGSMLGILGAIPWLVALLRRDRGALADRTLQEAGEEGLLLFIGTSTFSVGVALALLGWLPSVVYGVSS